MIDIEKLNSAKVWIEKLAKGINPLNDELVKEDDLINNVHISRCLFYVSELLGEIKENTSNEKRDRNAFFLSRRVAENIPVSTPNGIANFVKLVNAYIPTDMKPLSAAQVIRWLRNNGYLEEINIDDKHKTNLPTKKGNNFGISVSIQQNLNGQEYRRVMYDISAQQLLLSNIESIALSK